jgi:hypothetical protein
VRPYGERHAQRPRGVHGIAHWAYKQYRAKQFRRGAQTSGGNRHWYEPNTIADRSKERRHAREAGKAEIRAAIHCTSPEHLEAG